MSRYSTLDALRGIAAIGVMVTHTPKHPLVVPGGYLAVDLFFGLSGFVMALTYEDRLRQSLSAGRFMGLRIARLWPMLFLGALIGVTHGDGPPAALLLIPDAHAPDGFFAADPPLWSLLCELLAYQVFALFAPRIGMRALVLTVATCGLAMIAGALWGSHPLSAMGGSWTTLAVGGWGRVGYSFGLGVLMYRLRAAQGLPRVATGRAWLLAVALAYLMILVPYHSTAWGLLTILLAFPSILWLATKWEVPHVRAATMLSDLSYPLYCIHWPILWLPMLDGVPMVALWPLLIALSLGLDRWWDRPLRGWLRKWASGRTMGLKAA